VTDPSLKPDPTRKGSYYRRIEDIGRALDKLGVAHLPAAPQFVAYFFACEKLAHGVVGIVAAHPAAKEYHHRNGLRLQDTKTAAAAMKLRILPAELDCIFADIKEQHVLAGGAVLTSARVLRNNLTHDFGPTNAEKLVRSAPVLIPMMMRFLNCTNDVLAYQRTHFVHVA
jgi:hypothetical protein